MEQRVQELELRSMEQQALVQQLSDVLYAQQKELELLRSQVNQLTKRMQAEPGLVDAKQQERPPHY